MDTSKLIINKANVHNLKSINLELPKNNLIVITGPSGSGKSSLAFDTIYVEGQRRYIESLSSYARQFLGQYQPPDVESIEGLSPSIAIDQKTSSRNPRSTVGTITEIFDYLRVLYARVGTLYCPVSGKEIKKYTPHQICSQLMKNEERTKLQIIAPIKISSPSKQKISREIRKLQSQGFSRLLVNEEVITLDEEFKEDSLEKDQEGNSLIEVVIDRIVLKKEIKKRLVDSIEFALKLSNGIVKVLVGRKIEIYSEYNLSPETGEIFPELEPRLFSFNSPLGACPSCNGLGKMKNFDRELMVLDPNLSVLDGAITPLTRKRSFYYQMTLNMAEQEGIDLCRPLNKMSKREIGILFDGSEKEYLYSFESDNSNFKFKKAYPGLMRWLNKKYFETTSEKTRKGLEEFMKIKTCPDCDGQRLNRNALSTKIKSINIIELSEKPISTISQFFEKLKLTGEKREISAKIIKEIKARLQFLVDVGLDYLTLNRSASTLSGGESQRIRLATQIGSSLSGVLYVLDEPSIGLHQKDNIKLINTLKKLRDLGNTIIVVEHDEETIRNADYVVEIGPAAGIHGGEIVSSGRLKKFLREKSLTAKYLNKKCEIPIPKERRTPKHKISLKKASQNNIENLSVDFPLNCLLCISGVSGSGKSTLIHDILVPAIKSQLGRELTQFSDSKNFNAIAGVQHLKSVIELDQSPIGRTPHSNPATYTGLFTDVRTLFSQTKESQIRGYRPGRFSFNVKGGRCEECEGNGVKKIEMHFLPDVYITCTECKGTRFNQETLSILYKGLNVAEILDLTVEEALEFFKNHTRLSRILGTLNSVGLGYIKLGQPATTLSGGEAQRLKLSKELAKRTKGTCLYVLDEPTTGLHFDDVRVLMNAVGELIDKGNSVLIIEHNLDVIKTADYIIDLGPDGGSRGGKVVCQGTPEEITKSKKSHTARYLKQILTP